ncbi:MAG: polyprenyl synthetase family protein [Lentisphaerae bacterium]|jgi:geranylgeranyl diphosphate synthase type I|nr:polyprenyl synthetase family protein [Lentisphaerota bacterium]
MLNYIQRVRPGLLKELRGILDAYEPRLSRISPMGEELTGHLSGYGCAGKMVRGTLVWLGYELCASKAPDAAMGRALTRAGAAMEFFQTGLLIHDDIMDRDVLRRGGMTIHRRYEEAAAKAGAVAPAHQGMALGICAGDIAFYLGFYALATLKLPAAMAARARRVVAFAGEELCWVAVAQMQDVRQSDGGRNLEPTAEQILKLYRYKTGRYTFSLPLMIGAILAGATKADLKKLEEAGETLGVVFQLRDDELGIFGRAGALGKLPESDIREDKKTLLRHYLFAMADGDLCFELADIFGKTELTTADCQLVRDAMEQTGARARARRVMEDYIEAARQCLEALPVRRGPRAAQAREALKEWFRFNLERES